MCLRIIITYYISRSLENVTSVRLMMTVILERVKLMTEIQINRSFRLLLQLRLSLVNGHVLMGGCAYSV